MLHHVEDKRNLFRWCADIGMFAWDRARWSCNWRTSFCAGEHPDAKGKACFNDKFYAMYPSMAPCDARLEAKWTATEGDTVRAELRRKRKQTKRVRGCTRGETFSTMGDISKVLGFLIANPGTLFWLPTRAWRNPELRHALETLIAPMPNARLCASLDPSNTAEEWASLKASGWSTLFYGNDAWDITPNGDRMVKCPKTWKHAKGCCAGCAIGCFARGRTDVHLKAH